MKQVVSFLFSARLMAFIMIVFALSIGLATFIENDFGSESARSLVYNARWFELLLLLGVINLTGRIFIKKLYTRSHFSVFIFHIAFVVILTGAVITRYTGSEGTLSVREGQISNHYLTADMYLQVSIKEGHESVDHKYKISFSPVGRNHFQKKIVFGNDAYTLQSKAFIPQAAKSIEADETGFPCAEFIYADSVSRKTLIISKNEIKKRGNLVFAFDTLGLGNDLIQLTASNDSLYFRSTKPVTLSSMDGSSFTILEDSILHPLLPQHLYTFGDQMIVLNRYLPKGKTVVHYSPSAAESEGDALVLEISRNNIKKEVIVTGKKGKAGMAQTIRFENHEFITSYGSQYKLLPFEIKLKEFTIERYPGSNSPASFESFVTLVDRSRNLQIDRKIYMNNILKYKGYRFYQASYDADEAGTILAVNHDFAGTFISYLGYVLMGLGMLLSIFNKSSRLHKVSEELKKIKLSSRTVAVSLLFFIIPSIDSQTNSGEGKNLSTINAKHAAAFGQLLVQDNNGRIEPINTLSSELLRKLSRANSFKGMNADQVIIAMLTNSKDWQHEKIIRTSNSTIMEMMGSKDKFFAFSSFFKNDYYILQDKVEEAFRKRPAERTRFDNEIIRLDEKINIVYMIFSGELLRLFPLKERDAITWYNHRTISGRIQSEDSIFAENIVYMYVNEVQKSLESGNWNNADEIVQAIGKFQQKMTEGMLPSVKKITSEIRLNRWDIFNRLGKYYGIVGFFLLILQFVSIFYPKLNLKIPVTGAIALIICFFTMHSIGLGLRWYVSGHAPWSNGYEALTYVAWATVLAGIIFTGKSSVSLSISSILAALILFVAHLSWMDPQITNLVPVLKSYWLVIHVATITASYGFLAMGALLAFLNMVIMIIQTQTTRRYLEIKIVEISFTIEMALNIGLYLLSAGVFLGAVWANESWGRYWGWDPKETWALVTILVYAFILHMRMIPGLEGIYAFNLASLLGISSVLMTYFGVNYYLSGLHSYAKGDPLPVPAFIYYTLIAIAITSVLSYIKRPCNDISGDLN